MREIRDSLHAWMTDVLHERRWTAAEWARRAGVTATNVTRFLRDPDGASLPGAETLGRLARAAGREPRFLPAATAAPPALAAPGAWRVPVLDGDRLRRMPSLGRADAWAPLRDTPARGDDGCVLLDRPPSPHAFAVRIGSRHMNAGGVAPGDCVVVEPAHVRPPARGDLVVVLQGGAACPYRFYPPLLVPATTDPGCSEPLPCGGAAILGVGVHLARRLRA